MAILLAPACGSPVHFASDPVPAKGPFDTLVNLGWSWEPAVLVDGMAVTFAHPQSAPVLGPEDADACWLTEGVDLAGEPMAATGDTIDLTVGDTTVQLAQGTDKDPYYYLAVDGAAAQALAIEGAEVVLAGQPTSLRVPRALAGVEVDGPTDGKLSITWEADEGEDRFLQAMLVGDGPTFAWCALQDDGEARIDLGELRWSVRTLTLLRSEQRLVEVSTLGATLVKLQTGFLELL